MDGFGICVVFYLNLVETVSLTSCSNKGEDTRELEACHSNDRICRCLG